jgi:hypothetical protein
MPSIQSLLAALDERTIARLIGIPHDEARMQYSLRANIVGSFDEFSDRIGDYYDYHFTTCVSRGGALSRSEAAGRAKQILEQEYRRLGGDVVTSYNDAHEGTNGGLRGVLDKIAEALKAESVERYTREVFDRHIAPNAWEAKVEILRQFIRQCGAHLGSSIRADQPERYAHDYQELIRSYVAALRRTSAIFRRL